MLTFLCLWLMSLLGEDRMWAKNIYKILLVGVNADIAYFSEQILGL